MSECVQAHAPIAAVLLMQMPAEPAFWCLRAICNKYVPGYFSPGLVCEQLSLHFCFIFCSILFFSCVEQMVTFLATSAPAWCVFCQVG